MSRSVVEAMRNASIVSLRYYPIKGCAGIETPTIEVERAGFARDRRLMLIYPDGRFVSQRETGNTKLAVVSPRYVDENVLRVTAPGMPEPLTVNVCTEGDISLATVHKVTGIEVVDQGEPAANWFSAYLGKPVRLVAKAEGYHRQLNQDWSENSDDETVFADGFPILLTAIESLNALNQMLPERIPMSRFRPNVVISGSEYAFGEEELRRIMIGEISLFLAKLCTRCVVTSGDQIRGERDERSTMKGEPLKTLLKHRKITLKTGETGGVFGQNVIPENVGRLSLGMPIRVLETQPAPIYERSSQDGL